MMSCENMANTVNTVSYEEALVMTKKIGINAVTVTWLKTWLVEKYREAKI